MPKLSPEWQQPGDHGSARPDNHTTSRRCSGVSLGSIQRRLATCFVTIGPWGVSQDQRRGGAGAVRRHDLRGGLRGTDLPSTPKRFARRSINTNATPPPGNGGRDCPPGGPGQWRLGLWHSRHLSRTTISTRRHLGPYHSHGYHSHEHRHAHRHESRHAVGGDRVGVGTEGACRNSGRDDGYGGAMPC